MAEAEDSLFLPPENREQLDNKLDSYMADTKSVPDKHLDDYMIGLWWQMGRIQKQEPMGSA